ncbi:alcohol dehydrogenase catalytic domain-containing protein [Methylobacterium sp. CM6257]|jgi:threonine dehydrogenase-like Zn-dependent dehydrogenase
MLAMNHRGPYRVQVDRKPVPVCEHVQDAVVPMTRTWICGSDLHLYHGPVPDTRVGMTFGHDFIGVVVPVDRPYSRS